MVQHKEVNQKPQHANGKRVAAIFFRTEAGGEPVREWLKSLPFAEDRRRIGEDIQTVEFGWPVGMRVCRSDGRWPLRSADQSGVRPHSQSAVLYRQEGPYGAVARFYQEDAADARE